MMQARSWVMAMKAMGDAYLRRSAESLDKVVKALEEDVSIFDMSVDINSHRVPLDLFLATVRQITPIDEYFTGAPIFNIWGHLPLGLTDYQESLGVSPDKALRLLKRFNAYTWNEYSPELRKKYIGALRKTLWIADEMELNGWRAYTDEKPELIKTIELIIGDSEFSKLKNSIYPLKERRVDVKEVEDNVNQIPPERILNIFTLSGWKRINKREKMIMELEPRLKHEAQKVIEPLTELGKEYRYRHVSRHYPYLI